MMLEPLFTREQIAENRKRQDENLRLYGEVYGRVAQIAFQTVKDVMLENYESKMAEGDDWQEKSVEHHQSHAWAHLEKSLLPGMYPGRVTVDVREELEHALCRCAMALALLTASESQTPTEVPLTV